MILQHDNARPHVAKPVKIYLETLKWGVLPNPPYSPDIAPSDYYFYRSMAHGLADQQFRSYSYFVFVFIFCVVYFQKILLSAPAD